MFRPTERLAPLALCAVIGLCHPCICAAQVEIPDGTKVRVRLNQQLSSETAKEGDLVQLCVADDIRIGNFVAIKRGTPVEGRVLSASPTKSMGRAGKLDFSIDAILSSDGGKIPLRYSHDKNKGGSSLGTGVLYFALFGALGAC